MSSSPGEAAEVLRELASGDGSAAGRLVPLVYGELRALAAAFLRRERAGHTLQTTALVHEAYLRLVDQRQVDEASRTHFLAVAANVIRRVLVDHARGAGREKRGGGRQPIALEEELAITEERAVDVLELHEALEQLAGLHERQGRIVELRFFSGLTNEETARVLGVSLKTVTDDWRMARAWLHRKLGEAGPSGGELGA